MTSADSDFMCVTENRDEIASITLQRANMTKVDHGGAMHAQKVRIKLLFQRYQ